MQIMQSCFGPMTLPATTRPVSSTGNGRMSLPPGGCSGTTVVPRLQFLQDLNPYFIRQIARNLQEHDLEQKIDFEIKMREGTTKLLAASHHPSQLLEAAKSLLTSNERMAVYLTELQRRKSSQEGPENTEVADSKARMCVSDIRMPLIWKEGDHFKNKGDYRRFAVFCLLRVGTEVYDTATVNRVDRCMTDIAFDDIFVFNRVPPSFQFQLEVYSHVLESDLSMASTPRKIRHRINDSISRTVGRKLAASVKDELNAASDIGPRYELVARASLCLNDVNNNITTHDFQMENTENLHGQLPLFGHFCCRLAALPDILAGERQLPPKALQSGQLTLKCVDVPERQFSAVLRSSELMMYFDCDCADEDIRIPITKDTVVAKAGRRLEDGFLVTNVDEDRTITHHLVAGTADENDSWIHHLNAVTRCHEAWKHVASTAMEIYSPVSKRLPMFTVTRKASLYELTSLKDSPSTNAEPKLEMPVANSCRSSLPASFNRSRSSSISSTTTSSGCGSSSYDSRQATLVTRARHRLSCHETSV